MTILDTFSKLFKKKYCMEFTSVEIHPDAFDDKYHINIIETVPVYGGYSFERKRFVVEKKKIEKTIQELIYIVKE
jgi:hypothetical protein